MALSDDQSRNTLTVQEGQSDEQTAFTPNEDLQGPSQGTYPALPVQPVEDVAATPDPAPLAAIPALPDAQDNLSNLHSHPNFIELATPDLDHQPTPPQASNASFQEEGHNGEVKSEMQMPVVTPNAPTRSETFFKTLFGRLRPRRDRPEIPLETNGAGDRTSNGQSWHIFSHEINVKTEFSDSEASVTDAAPPQSNYSETLDQVDSLEPEEKTIKLPARQWKQLASRQKQQESEKTIKLPAWQRKQLASRQKQQESQALSQPAMYDLTEVIPTRNEHDNNIPPLLALPEALDGNSVEIVSHCQRCNAQLPAGARLCDKCGSPLVNEAEPAEGVSPDQASVPMPLIAAQNSPVRIRPLASNHQIQRRQSKDPGPWITVLLMVCLIGGLGAYLFLPSRSNPVSGTVQVVPPGQTAQPALSLGGPQSAPIQQGHALILHGDHFGAHDTITFLLDSTTHILDQNGNILAVRASNAGGFDVLILIQGSAWSAAPHYIQAVDQQTQQNAYLNIVVSHASTPEASSSNLVLFQQGTPLNKLTFHAVVGQGNPNQQRVTLSNTSSLPLHWAATAIADHNLTWLVLDDNHTAGNLEIKGTDSLGISVLVAGLKSNPPAHPYTGQIVFTINGQEQLALPVELQVANPQPEIVFSPNPVVALLGAGKTCQVTTLTLINLGNSYINWTLVPYIPGSKDRIHFLANGQAVTQGVLATSGDAGDTQILNLQCYGVSAGDTYKFTMYAGNASWSVTIFVRTSS